MIGLYGKDNKKGLGTLTRQYVRHLPIDRVLIKKDNTTQFRLDAIYSADPDRELDRFLDGLDTVILLETNYPLLMKKAKKKGIRIILKVNYEFLPPLIPIEPDLYFCSSSKNYEAVKSENKVLLPDPVELLPFQKRTQALTFLHNAGQTLGDANGTKALLEAIQFVQSDVRFIINTPDKLKVDDPRVEVRHHFPDSREDLFKDGDVFISLQRFRATSLPIQEAMSAGMPVLTTDIQPFNEFCQFLVKPSRYTKEELSRRVDYAIMEVRDVAEKIDEIANTDIGEQSEEAREYAESISWDNLKDEYIKWIKKK